MRAEEKAGKPEGGKARKRENRGVGRRGSGEANERVSEGREDGE